MIGYGKLGGKELGYASDLDLIFLYDDDHPDAADNYARLAQRINTWLTSFTPAGVLYETDLRLRPDGASGLLVSRLDAFAQYQRSKAWVVGAPGAHPRALRGRATRASGRASSGCAWRSCACRASWRRCSSEVQAMRSRMLAGHPNTSGLFDIKHDRGGIVDVEFIVQYLVLGFAHRHAELTGNIGNLALLKLAGGLGLIPDDARQRRAPQLPGVPAHAARAAAAGRAVCAGTEGTGERAGRPGDGAVGAGVRGRREHGA